MNEIFILLIAFQIKHFLADYPLQFPYMYENKGKKERWLLPLLNHASTHGILTWIIVTSYAIAVEMPLDVYVVFAFITMWVDIATHFFIDRWKATQKGGPDTDSFWINLGVDQMLHHLVGIFIVYTLVQY